jgi:hypothetical protein
VKPASASIPALTPAIAPQPDPSLTIVGWSMQRIIWLRGRGISAMPSASRVRARSSPMIRAYKPAELTRPHAPDVW